MGRLISYIGIENNTQQKKGTNTLPTAKTTPPTKCPSALTGIENDTLHNGVTLMLMSYIGIENNTQHKKGVLIYPT